MTSNNPPHGTCSCGAALNAAGNCWNQNCWNHFSKRNR